MRPGVRMLLSPRWIGRTLLALAAITVCLIASVWQYERTQDQLAVARAAIADPVPYAEVMAGLDEVTAEALGRQVVVTGELVPGARSFVRSRTNTAGDPGYLVVDAVRSADGPLVAVLQGWVPDPAAVPAPTGDDITVAGRIQPDENFYSSAPIDPAKPLVTITRDGLAEQWGQAPSPGYVVATVPVAGVERSTPLVGTDPDVPFPIQNIFYSLQWLVFAGFVVFMWVRWFRLDLRETHAGGPDPATEGESAEGARVSL